ncbi:DEAD/DEAH box helicase [Mucilaginibacter sp.]|uniref:DEAD/DEAH box helicase n=1 Tax=Mucilaginibacter sp. TaxID=1882438 RepID=UPI002614541F|nr:DEAD/DEAH box helicase [Mucilaginibacter sp.]
MRTITEAGYISPKEVQQKTLARIYGGQDVVVAGPEGCGKTTTYILAVLNRIKYNAEGVPLVLILVPTKEDVLAVISGLEHFSKNKQIAIVGLYAAIGTETQMNALADGADIVVATPDRARAIYLKLGLNLNKIELLIVDDADLIVKQGLQLPVAELANSITKCQHLVFTEVIHDRLNKMIAPFMQSATTVEIEEIAESVLETHSQLLYHVPNFITKLNLLNLFMQDSELFTKTVVFVNTRHTAEKIYKTLQNRQNNSIAVLNSWSVELNGFKEIKDFKTSANTRVLIICNEDNELTDLHNIPFLIHFELPEEKEVFIKRVLNNSPESGDETLAITFTTDLELTTVRRIEQAIGQKIPIGELPEDLVIEQDKKQAEVEEKKPVKNKTAAPVAGDAFHQKKPENSKTYNYSSGVKAKMNMKKKHG